MTLPSLKTLLPILHSQGPGENSFSCERTNSSVHLKSPSTWLKFGNEKINYELQQLLLWGAGSVGKSAYFAHKRIWHQIASVHIKNKGKFSSDCNTSDGGKSQVVPSRVKARSIRLIERPFLKNQGGQHWVRHPSRCPFLTFPYIVLCTHIHKCSCNTERKIETKRKREHSSLGNHSKGIPDTLELCPLLWTLKQPLYLEKASGI